MSIPKNISQKRKSKYGNKKTVYKGIEYDSKKEATYASRLNMLTRASGDDRVILIERQVPFQITVNGIKICKYILDFRVTYSNRVEHIDVKGYRTDVYKIKKKLTEALWGIKIIEV